MKTRSGFVSNSSSSSFVVAPKDLKDFQLEFVKRVMTLDDSDGYYHKEIEYDSCEMFEDILKNLEICYVDD